MPSNDRQPMPERSPDGRNSQATPREDPAAPAYVRFSQRRRPPRAGRSAWALVAVVVAAHLLLAWIAWLILRPTPYQRAEGEVLRVTLIDSGAGLPPPPPLVPPPPLAGQPRSSTPPRRVHYEPPARGAMRATIEGAKGPQLELYDNKGQVRLPQSPDKSAPAPAYTAPAIEGSQIYSGKSPLPYKPTRFNKDWAPANESLGAKTVGRAFDKAVDATTLKKTVTLPGGIKVHCAIAPLLLMAAGCMGDAPPPPPKNDDDIRLSMPPAETLTGEKVPLPKSGSGAAPAASSQPPPAAASSR